MARRATLGLVVGAVVGVFLSVPTPAAQAEEPWAPGPELYGHVVTKDVPVTMEDGRVLRAAIYTPTMIGTETPRRVSSR